LIWPRRSAAVALTIFIVGLASTKVRLVSAADAAPSTDAAEAQLLKKVQERDAVIRDLQRRVEELERQTPKAPEQKAPAPAAARPAPPPPRPPEEAVPPQEARPRPAAPGQFEVDEDAAERALERTLVQAGVLLLPLGVLEIEPSLAYTRAENQAPNFFTDNSGTFIATEKLRRNIYDADVQLRIGTWFDSQIELRVPYRYVDQSQVRELGFTPTEEQNQHGSALGDIRIGLAKTLVREGPWWPDLVGRLSWDSDTGDTTDNDVALGGGFNQIIAELSAVKRQDPLAFVGAFSYEKPFEKDDIKPGQQFRLALGVAMAASPETSLRFVLDQAFVDDLEVNNQKIDGSNQVVGTLTIGASSIVGRGTFLDVSGDVGLTDDAPDYSVRLSLSKRFDLRSLF
jgi:hypothetical protein